MEQSKIKQSSIDWLIEQLKEYDFSPRENTYLIEIPSWIFTEKIEQAKAMHKEEIIEANSIGYTDGIMYANGEKWVYQNSEHYYEETFGGNNEQQ